jgi:hypothetical protein
VPIGNQTSPLLANVYLDPLDHFLEPTFPGLPWRKRAAVTSNR